MTQAVDLAAIPANQAAVVQDGSLAARSTAAVFIPFLDASHYPTFSFSDHNGLMPVRGTCGVTFVSPHYAITSSHCFADTNAYDPANQVFTTTSYDVGSANVNDFYFDAAMQGTFPDYTPLFGHTMPQAAGYTATSFTCKIASRCAYGAASNYNCDGISASDVTMLYCSSRSSYGAWVPIANDAATTGPVSMYWFHELFMVNNDEDRIAHYTNLGAPAQNWHYLGAPSNALLPFKSVPWASGAARGRFGAGGSNDVKTDLYGCHGTSGSGVLNASGTALLGPVHNGGAWASGQLCDDPSALTQGAPGGHGLTYNSNVSVNNLVNAKYLTALQNDRYPAPPPPVCGDGICSAKETHASCPADCDAGDCPAGRVDCCGDGICRTATLCSKMHCL